MIYLLFMEHLMANTVAFFKDGTFNVYQASPPKLWQAAPKRKRFSENQVKE